MANFEQIRQQVSDSGAQRSALQQQLFIIREQIKKTEARLKDLERRFQANDPKALQERSLLQDQLKKQQGKAAQIDKKWSAVQDQWQNNWAEFTPFTDPRLAIQFFQDRTPILMFPLRLETRFKTITNAAAGIVNQLWVRVFPDDCNIDTFEPLLSEAEAANVQRFWAGYWSSGADEAGQRGAWKALVNAHGAGRAGYLVRQYQPKNTAPLKAAPQDVILAVVDATGLPASDQTALSDYWKAVWLADGNRALSDQAWNNLIGAVGQQNAEQLTRDYRPQNLAERPPAPYEKNEVALQLVFVQFPTEEEFPTKRLSWSQAAQARLLPERLVLLGYRNGDLAITPVLGNLIPTELAVGPDPQDASQFTKTDGELEWGTSLRWMSDFDEAVKKGMGFRVNLTAQEAQQGFDRLLVVGIRASANKEESATQLEDLLHNHLRSKNSLAILPQGTATNNTESGGAYFERTDDPDDSFDVFLKNTQQFTIETDDRLKKDGQWLAQWLGIKAETLQQVPNAGQTDQCEARAMNLALWPATLGYFMDSAMHPVFDDDDSEFVRTFFTRYVSGRGPLPALRIGKQPYGILLTTPFSRQEWLKAAFAGGFTTHASTLPGAARLAKLYQVLLKLESDWKSLLPAVSFVGKPNPDKDAHQMLLDILGLHPSSEEFYYRYAHSLEYLLNWFRFLGFGSKFEAGIKAWVYKQGALNLLGELGYNGAEPPDILEKFFFSRQYLLSRFLIDDSPLSETAAIRSYTTDPADGNNPAAKNYIEWLHTAAAQSLDTVRKQTGFFQNKPPQTLLYLLLRHALLTGYHDTGLRLLKAREVYDAQTIRQLKLESKFVNVAEKSASLPESRFQMLYEPVKWQSNAPNQSLLEYIAVNRLIVPEINHLNEQIDALKHLDKTPTARLERLLVEHLDLCSYRLDAWKTGLTHLQLDLMRRNPDLPGGNGGIYLGAYGWLENVRPENKPLTPVQLSPELSAFFQKNNPNPILLDQSNGGHVLAPSLNQAVTAAILRNGYKANLAPGQPEALAVDLSSERVRLALGILEGMRNGQKLGALLGYRFERSLHDRQDNLELDRFILPFRQAFPLTARRIKTTKAADDTSVEALEARNVMDGLALVKHVNKTGQKTYPYGKSAILPSNATAQEQAAIDAEVLRLLALQDAVADLAIAESVHQVVLGNYERTAANLDAYAGAAVPPEPEVVRTPRSGHALTHRVGIHFDPNALAAANANPRVAAEPGVEQWLNSVMPGPADLACLVEYRVFNAAGTVTEIVTAADLKLSLADLLYQYAADRGQTATSLDDRIAAYIAGKTILHPGSAISIKYAEPIGNKKTFFEVNPLLESLSALLLQARPLQAADVQPPAQTTAAMNSEPWLDAGRIQAVVTALQNFLTNTVQPLAADLQARFDPLPVQEAFLVQQIDNYLQQFAGLTHPSGNFGLQHAGFVPAWAERQQIMLDILAKIDRYAEKWTDKLLDFDDLIGNYAGTIPAERKNLLLQAERTLRTASTNPDSIADLDAFKTVLETSLRTDFSNRLSQIKGLAAANGATLSGLLAAAGAMDNSAFDAEAFDFIPEKQRIIRLADDLRARSAALKSAIQQRLDSAAAHIAASQAAADASSRVQALLEAGKALLGEDFRMFPAFSLRSDHANEWANAWNDRAALLAFATAETPFPVDDWLYGVARVREKMRHYENVLLLSDALDAQSPELTPLQFPYQISNYHWLAVAFPAGLELPTETLLYTAHYAQQFNSAARQCGALVEEWTEVIPGNTETAGLAFHYDRPNNEAPQTWLLATPANFANGWQWNDLVDAVHEALDAAQLRAVEPSFLENTYYAPFLPATVSAAAAREVSIIANYALAANLLQVLPQ